MVSSRVRREQSQKTSDVCFFGSLSDTSRQVVIRGIAIQWMSLPETVVLDRLEALTVPEHYVEM